MTSHLCGACVPNQCYVKWYVWEMLSGMLCCRSWADRVNLCKTEILQWRLFVWCGLNKPEPPGVEAPEEWTTLVLSAQEMMRRPTVLRAWAQFTNNHNKCTNPFLKTAGGEKNTCSAPWGTKTLSSQITSQSPLDWHVRIWEQPVIIQTMPIRHLMAKKLLVNTLKEESPVLHIVLIDAFLPISIWEFNTISQNLHLKTWFDETGEGGKI